MGPGYYQQPPRGRRVWPWLFGGLVLIVFLAIGGFAVFVHRLGSNIEESSKYAVVVTSKDVSTGGNVSLTATNDQSGGTITCRIFANGKQISEQATGPLASARCSGDVGLLPAR